MSSYTSPPVSPPIAPYATVAGTTRYQARFAHLPADHFRQRYGLWLSSIGLGSYLQPTPHLVGMADATSDSLGDAQGYHAAVAHALALGCNVLDTAINYRGGLSEQEVGRGLAAAIAAGTVQRDEVLLCSKGGYLATDPGTGEQTDAQSGEQSGRLAAATFDMNFDLIDDRAASESASADEAEDTAQRVAQSAAHVVEAGLALPEEIVGDSHCMAPAFLHDQITRSLTNLGVETIDVYYLHNPETQLQQIGPHEFKQRLRRAFEQLETEAAAGRIRLYGVATWDGLHADRQDRIYLPLTLLEQIAREVGGEKHRFRFVQFPYNILTRTAFSAHNQPLPQKPVPSKSRGDATIEDATPQFGPVLAAAMQLGLTAVTSTTLAQGRVLDRLPAQFGRALGEWESRAQAAIQFSRSTPGVTTALVGMGRTDHVDENLAVAQHAPLPRNQFFRLFQRPATSGPPTDKPADNTPD
ncbi:MAG: aldo/keto reductase [Litorilinea sp.]